MTLMIQRRQMGNPMPKVYDLNEIFNTINQLHFDGFLDVPKLVWNSRLRSCAGRFIPGSRKYGFRFPPQIEVASYLCEELKAQELITDTVAHEMIHYWLWVRKRPYGHTPEFYSKMRELGVSRYNPVPRTRAYKYLYLCKNCQKKFPAKRKLGPLACSDCCKKYSNGVYNSQFRLVLSGTWGENQGVSSKTEGGSLDPVLSDL